MPSLDPTTPSVRPVTATACSEPASIVLARCRTLRHVPLGEPARAVRGTPAAMLAGGAGAPC
jgi:hypothetical protein